MSSSEGGELLVAFVALFDLVVRHPELAQTGATCMTGIFRHVGRRRGVASRRLIRSLQVLERINLLKNIGNVVFLVGRRSGRCSRRLWQSSLRSAGRQLIGWRWQASISDTASRVGVEGALALTLRIRWKRVHSSNVDSAWIIKCRGAGCLLFARCCSINLEQSRADQSFIHSVQVNEFQGSETYICGRLERRPGALESRIGLD